MSDSLSGVRVAVTGCARGIGAAIALAAAEAGADIAGFDCRDLSATASAVQATGRRMFARTGDAAADGQVHAFASEAAETFGGLDGWVKNAGILLARPFLKVTGDNWWTVLATNLGGYINGARAALQAMLPAGAGTIVNVSSVTDIQPAAGLAACFVSKGGIVALTKALAVEFASQGIRVNAVAPGAVDTELNARAYTEEVRRNYRSRIPLGRIATLEDIAEVVVSLLSDASRYMTGVEVLVDGGLVCNGNIGHRVS